MYTNGFGYIKRMFDHKGNGRTNFINYYLLSYPVNPLIGEYPDSDIFDIFS
jgi:hypothetical protein